MSLPQISLKTLPNQNDYYLFLIFIFLILKTALSLPSMPSLARLGTIQLMIFRMKLSTDQSLSVGNSRKAISMIPAITPRIINIIPHVCPPGSVGVVWANAIKHTIAIKNNDKRNFLMVIKFGELQR